MSVDTVADTMYSDSQVVVITMRPILAPTPWLGQTTYPVDRSEQATAALALTDRPAGGVTLAPGPYTTLAQIPVPSTIPRNLPSGWAYEGCYDDLFPSGSILSVKQPYNSDLTVQACVWSCFGLGYSIAGLEDRRQCFCGNAILNGGTRADSDSECNTPCAGNGTEICGGSNRLSKYSNRTLATSQSTAAQSSGLIATAPTVAATATSATSRKPIASATIAAAVIGPVGGIAIMIALIIYFRRRIKKNHAQTKSQMQTPPGYEREWPLADRVKSWEEFMEATKEHYARLDESIMRSVECNGSGLGLKSADFGFRPSLAELRQEYERLRRTKQDPPYVNFDSSDRYLAPPAMDLPLQRAPARAQKGQPTSILKDPRPTVTSNRAHNSFDKEEEQDPRRFSVLNKRGLAKKCVRFGVNQIREFGRSPFIGHGSNASGS